MKTATAATLMVGALLVRCGAPTPGPTASSTQGEVAPAATLVPPTAVPTPTPTDTPASTRTPASTPEPTETPTPSYPATATPTGTPEGLPQIYVGIPYEAINNRENDYGIGCGNSGIMTRDLDQREGATLDFWQAHPEVPEPEGFTHRTKDGKYDMDYCTHIGFPITFVQEEGTVVNIQMGGQIDVLITKGVGTGLVLRIGHLNPDTDLDTPGMQYLARATIVHQGQTLGYTDRFGIPEDVPVGGSGTMVTILPPPGADSHYHPDMEWMLIGPDGQPNILY